MTPLAPAIAATWRAELDVVGAGPAARANLEAIATGRARVVVTGQQPGLFLGPCYTLYKACHAIAEARRLAAAGGGPIVPVFWVASEDHDWAESAVVRLPPRGDSGIREFRLPLDGGGRALEAIPLPAETMGPLVAAFRAAVGDGPGATLVDAAFAAARPESLGRLACSLLAALFRDEGLVPVEARILRPAAAAILARERDDPAGGIAALAAGAAALRAAGREAPLPAGSDRGPLVFEILTDGRRRRATGTPTAGAVLSPDVALRPVVQDAVLPVAAHVVGPGEAAYLAQLGPLYARHGVAEPARIARFSATVVSARIAAACRALGLSPADASAAGTVAPAGPALDARIGGALAALEQAIEPPLATLAASPAARPSERFARGVRGALGRLRRRLEAQARAEAGSAATRFARVRDHLRPLGQPQERVFGCWSYLASYGRPLLEHLLRAAGDPATPQHFIQMDSILLGGLDRGADDGNRVHGNPATDL